MNRAERIAVGLAIIVIVLIVWLDYRNTFHNNVVPTGIDYVISDDELHTMSVDYATYENFEHVSKRKMNTIMSLVKEYVNNCYPDYTGNLNIRLITSSNSGYVIRIEQISLYLIINTKTEEVNIIEMVE